VAIQFQAHSPVTLSVTDPEGFTLSSGSWIVAPQEAYRSVGSLFYNDYSPNGDDIVFSPILENGSYIVRPIPKPGASPQDTYSLTVTVGSNSITLAQNVPISLIPPLGYGIESEGTTIIPFTPLVSFGGAVQQAPKSDGQGHFVTQVTITNQGNVTVDSAQIVAAGTTLGTAVLVSAPAAITNLAPRASVTATLTFPITTALSTATSAPLKINGTYSAGPLSGNWSVTFRSVTLSY
jgi:archaellum component FlaF (FlaF/FlaG flagellin family)